jgi:signal transduction histidine kinase
LARTFPVREVEGNIPALKLFRIAQTKRQGWHEYLWPNPASRHVERKVTFVLRIDDLTLCASGHYKPD